MDKIKEIAKKNPIIVGSIAIAILVILFAAIAIWTYQPTQIQEEMVARYFLLYEKEKMGIINTQGKVIIQPEYEEIQIPDPSKDVFICSKDGKTEVLDEQQQRKLEKYDKIQAIQKPNNISGNAYFSNILLYEKNGKYGLIDLEGKKITNAVYDEIKSLDNREKLLVKKEEKYGILNFLGKEIIKPKYHSIQPDSYYESQQAGYIVQVRTQEGYRFGYCDPTGKEVIEPIYTDLYRINEIVDNNRYLVVAQKGQYGVFKNQDLILDHNYQEIQYNTENQLFILKRNINYGVANKEGKIIIPVNYNEISIEGKYIDTKKDNVEQRWDREGKQVEDSKYQKITKTNNEKYWIAITKEGKYGILNKDEEVKIENEYLYLEYLFDDYFIAENQEEKFGIMDIEKKVYLEFEYDVLQQIKNTSILQAKKIEEDISQFYNKQMQLIGEIKGATVYTNSDYIKVVSPKDGIFYYDVNGNSIKNIDIFKENRIFAFEQNEKWGYQDKQGNIIVPAIYDKVTEINSYGYGGIQQDGKWGSIDSQGNIVIEPTYVITEEPESIHFIDQYYRVYYQNGEYYYTNNK